MKISIAMATFRGTKFLPEQFDSLVQQTRLPDELVISDDASNDETLAIISEFAGKAPFLVKVVTNKTNIGYAANFARAAMQCNGDVICFCDQDDFWLAEKLQENEVFFQNHSDCFLLINDAELTNENLEPVGLTLFGQAEACGSSMESPHFHMGCCMSFRREILPLLAPAPVGGHDTFLSEICAMLGCRCSTRKVLQYYRRHSATATNSVGAQLRYASRLKMLRQLIRWNDFAQDAATVNEIRTARVRSFLDRLRSNERLLCQELMMSDRYSAAISQLERQLAAEMARFAVQRLPVHRRLIAACAFYSNDGYSEFQGIRSLVKDLIRLN